MSEGTEGENSICSNCNQHLGVEIDNKALIGDIEYKWGKIKKLQSQLEQEKLERKCEAEYFLKEDKKLLSQLAKAEQKLKEISEAREQVDHRIPISVAIEATIATEAYEECLRIAHKYFEEKEK